MPICPAHRAGDIGVVGEVGGFLDRQPSGAGGGLGAPVVLDPADRLGAVSAKLAVGVAVAAGLVTTVLITAPPDGKPEAAPVPLARAGRQPATTYLTNTKDPGVGAPMSPAA